MTRRAISPKWVLFCLCAGAFLSQAAPASAQGRLDAQYEASLSGIPVGRGSWTIEIGDETFSAAAVMELYRQRWQIELAIKRLKSLLGLGHLPKKDPPSARAWLHGKLFVSLLVERVVEAANTFSPWGYELESAP